MQYTQAGDLKEGNKMNKAMRKNTIRKLLALAAAMMLVFTACSGSQSSAAGSNVAETTGTTVYDTASKSEMFTDRDLSGEYDGSEAVRISLDGNSASAEEGSGSDSVTIDGSTVTISAEGTYIFSGTLSDGMIIVDADDSAKVQIVLDGASVTCETSAALYVKSADKVFVTTAEGTENTLANGGTFTAIDDNNIDGAVFAKDDITFNGSGSLTVTSPAGHGIVGKDDVKIAGGTVSITAAEHGIQANDSVRCAEAEITVTAGTDGVHVSDNSDEEEGTASDSYFYMADAELTIEAGDDGIHADAQALIEGGSITVTKSYEGLEALDINISGGNIDLTATDDGINAAGGSTSSGSASEETTSENSGTFGEDDWFGGNGGFPGGGGFDDGGTDGSIVISDGYIHVAAGGDGLDANGTIEISGGTTIVEGPSSGDTSVMDCNSTSVITGGVFIGTGGAGMAQNFSSVENQGLIAVSTGDQSAGTAVKLTDSDGNVIAEQTPELDYAVVYISAPALQQGGTYTLTAGSYSETIELTEAIYSSISGGMMGGGDMSGGMPGEAPQGGMPGEAPQDGMSGEAPQNGPQSGSTQSESQA